MNWVRIIWLIIQYTPKIISLFSDIMAEIDGKPKPEKKAAKVDLKESLEESKRNRSFAPLERLRGRLGRR